jgi:hypothetical protein
MIEKVIFVATMILVLAIIFQEPIFKIYNFFKNEN